MNNKKLLMSLFVVTTLFLGTWTYTRAGGEQITVCIKKNGLVYVIGEAFKRTECKGTDSLLSWNSDGVQGPKGGKGDTGEQGPKGDRGDSGSAEMLPETMRPTLQNLAVCRSSQTITLKWDLTNSFGSVVAKEAVIHGNGLSWGTLSVQDTERGTLTRKGMRSVSAFAFAYPEWNFGGTDSVPFTFTGGVEWEGFVIPINITGMAPPDGGTCVNI